MKKVPVILIIGLFLALVFAGAAAAITNGQPDGNNHPYVGIMVNLWDDQPAGYCSCVAISPTVVVTAAHCAWTEEVVVSFEENPIDWENFDLINKVHGYTNIHPEYCPGCSISANLRHTHDIAVIVLDEPLTISRYAQLPTENFVDTLPMNTPIDVVGYGDQFDSGGGPRFPPDGLLTRYYASSLLVTSEEANSQEYLKLTTNPAQGKGGICFGDSGGPDLKGGTDIVLGINTYVHNRNCAGLSFANRLDTYALEFIEFFLNNIEP